jgi:hypothetical protein
MSKKDVEALLIKGGEDKKYRLKFEDIDDKQKFADLAKEDGFEFTVEELDEVLRESGDAFESFGNPRKKQIWWT